MRAAANITTPDQYIASLPVGERETVQAVHDVIRATVPKLEPFISGGMMGYGRYWYRYESGREGESAVVGLTAQKRYISLYVCAADAKGYLPEQYRAHLPRADVGKCCIRFRRFEDLDLPALRKLLKHAQRLGGASAVSD